MLNKEDTAKHTQLRLYGERIAAYRRIQGLSQEQLAESVGLVRASIANIELGRQSTSLLSLRDICNVLRVTPNDVLLDEPMNEALMEQLGAIGLRRTANRLREQANQIEHQLRGKA